MMAFKTMGASSSRANAFAGTRGGWLWCVGLIAILMGSIAVLVWYAQRPNQALIKFEDKFTELRAQEARWDAGILALQLGIAPNYDEVSITSRDLEIGLISLSQYVNTETQLSALAEALLQYKYAVANKSAIFQQVKASYAMLRNAVAVLPRAIAECYIHPEVASSIAGESRRVSDLITESINGVMSFLITPTPLLQREVNDRLAQLRDVLPTASPELSDALARLLAQVDVVVRERFKGNQLSLQLEGVPTDNRAEVVTSQLQSLLERHESFKKGLWIAASVLSTLVVLTFFFLTLTLFQRFLKLDKDNVMLQQANENVEERLLQSAKLSALGQMVAGITHEINTPLAYVRAVFELIRERVVKDKEPDSVRDEEAHEELVMLLDDGLHGLDEIATLVRTMKNFSRLDKGTIEPFSVEEGLESALLLAKPQLKYVADVKREFDAVPQIMGSPTQLRQVFLNLIVNAADAIAATGRRGTLTLRTMITSSDTVQIDICDDGPGISEDDLSKIFDPFFTTKPVGHGTGMGLSICYRIIENHGGTIAINSRVGKGTAITLVLPRQDASFKSTDAAIASDVRGGSALSARL